MSRVKAAWNRLRSALKPNARVNQSRQEIGIRLALGAPANLVRWSIQKRALLLVCCGLLIGLPVTAAISKFMSSLLYETGPVQAGAYVIVLIVFIDVALVAKRRSLPPRRAYGSARRHPSRIIA